MQDFYAETVEKLREILKEGLEKFCEQEAKEKKELEFLIEEPEREEFGDLATNIFIS